jgi:MtN3 and saliva related transmembrane protein
MRGGWLFLLEERMTNPGTRQVELIGFVAAFCTTMAFVPQLLRVVKLRSAREISLGTFLLFSVGVALWLLYGLYTGSKPVIASNLVTLVLSVSILVLKLRYDRRALEKEVGV